MHLALIFITMSYKKNNWKRNFAILLIISLISVILISSALTLNSVSITPDSEQNPKTTDDLNCTWSYTDGGTNVRGNVTWYNGSVEFLKQYNQTNYALLNNTYTAEGETWNCTVVLGNETVSISNNLSYTITIKNSPPDEPFVQYLGNNIDNYLEITEDIEYIFLLNTSDPDPSDTLSYSLTSTASYCSIDTNSGVITCNATAQPDTAVNDRYWFYANDGTIAIGTYADFNVTPVNDRPYFSSGPDNHTMNENETMTYSFTVSDEENNTGAYIFDLNYNITSEFGDDRLNITNADNVFSIKFENNRKSTSADVGNTTVYLAACDPEDYNLCINDSFNLEVISINHWPNLSLIQNSSAAQGDLLEIFINATDEDISNELEFQITGLNCVYDPWNITTVNSSINATGLINMTLNNSHVLCPNVTVTINDNYGGSDSQNVYFNITNRDDSPIIYNLSYSTNNTHGNNLSSIITYTNTLFTYQINGTDPDLGYDSFETISYTENSSLCGANCPTINISTSGLINQTFTQSGNFSYEINLTDYYYNYTTAIMNIEIIDNAYPFYNHTIINLTANETIEFSYKMNATDPEGTHVNFTDNTTIFNITNEGLINHNYSCSDIGNYSVEVTITDQGGAENSTQFNFEITNLPQTPVLPNFGNLTIWEGISYNRNIRSETVDYDLNEYCSKTTDSLTYTSRFTVGTTLFNVSSIGLISDFTPTKAQPGSYRINITVIDSYGLNSSKLWNLTIANRSDIPTINNITPHGKPMNLTWALESDYNPLNLTNTNTTENSTVYFDHNSTDPNSDPLVFNWTYDGSAVSYDKNYSRFFDFDDSGTYNITLTVSDNASGSLEHYVKFTWNLTVDNKNRAPLLNNTLPNISVNTTTLYETYLTGGIGNIKFNDPDGDTLTYNNSPTSKATITYSGNSMTITPLEIGVEEFKITASDGTQSITSTNITLNITGVVNTTEESSSSDTSSGSSGSRTEVVPYTIVEEVEIEKDVYLDIINPEPAVIYSNNTLRQVISIINSGNKTLRGITLSAVTNSTTAYISFSNNYINELAVGETQKTDLIIVDYQIYNNYQIVIQANVTDPVYKDKAVIYINALTKSRGNQSLSRTKITFAADLLASNPECVELNEFLKKSRELMEQQNYEEAAKITDAVIQGCKYLVSQSKLVDERPTNWVLNLGIDKVPYLKIALIMFVLAMIVTATITFKLKKSNDDEVSKNS